MATKKVLPTFSRLAIKRAVAAGSKPYLRENFASHLKKKQTRE